MPDSPLHKSIVDEEALVEELDPEHGRRARPARPSGTMDSSPPRIRGEKRDRAPDERAVCAEPDASLSLVDLAIDSDLEQETNKAQGVTRQVDGCYCGSLSLDGRACGATAEDGCCSCPTPPCFDDDDDGVPPFCRDERCPLDHRNPCLNDNETCLRWGNVGLPFFDRHRKTFMEIAMVFTIFAMVVTTAGCFSLSTERSIVKLTYWIKAEARNYSLPDHGPILEEVYLGLSSALIYSCEPNAYGHAHSTGCAHSEMSFYKLGSFFDPRTHRCPADVVLCAKCDKVAVNLQVGAFLSCVSLIFALIGTINRRKRKADAPIQKLLGCIFDTWGALSLSFSLADFATKCYREALSMSSGHGMHYDTELGPGFWLYAFCAVAGFVRAAVHWLTPLPDQGAGACSWQLPSPELLTQFAGRHAREIGEMAYRMQVQMVDLSSATAENIAARASEIRAATTEISANVHSRAAELTTEIASSITTGTNQTIQTLATGTTNTITRIKEARPTSLSIDFDGFMSGALQLGRRGSDASEGRPSMGPRLSTSSI